MPVSLISLNVSPYPNAPATFTVPTSTEVGDLIILHLSNGNSATGSVENIAGFVKSASTANGRSLFSRVAQAEDAGKTYTVNNKPSAFGWMLFVFRNATLHDMQFTNKSSYNTPALPQDGLVYHISISTGAGNNDFNLINSSDPSNYIRVKNFAKGTTSIGTLPIGMSAWHTNLYMAFIVVATKPPADAKIEVATSDDGIIFSSYTAFDPASLPQKRYLKFKAKIGGGVTEGKTSTFEFDQSKPETKIALNDFLESVSTNVKPKTLYTQDMVQDITYTDAKLFTASVDRTQYKKITKLEVK